MLHLYEKRIVRIYENIREKSTDIVNTEIHLTEIITEESVRNHGTRSSCT